jgi:putative copper export protein
MIQADTFVGALAIVLGIAIGATALTPATTRVQLGIAQSVRKRFGDVAARAVITLIATLLLVAGVMILRDLRPSFASPLGGNAGPEEPFSDSVNR